MPTPFDIGLAAELDAELLRFSNQWLFPWHQINSNRHSTEVDNFQGSLIKYAGIEFEGSPRIVYWDAISRYLRIEAHKHFDRWNSATRDYPPKMRLAALEATEGLLQSFSGQVIERSVDTDRRLRGKGFPRNVPAHDARREDAEAKAEIFRLAEAHRSLLAAQLNASPQGLLAGPTLLDFEAEVDFEGRAAIDRLRSTLRDIEGKRAANGGLLSGATVKMYAKAAVAASEGLLGYLLGEIDVLRNDETLSLDDLEKVAVAKLASLRSAIVADETITKLEASLGGSASRAELEERLRKFDELASVRFRRLRLELPKADYGSNLHGEGVTVSNSDFSYDVFISHASEDKEEFVRGLALALKDRGLSVWYDEFSLKWGDSLRREIDRGLAGSRFGVVVLSRHFFAKPWPQSELDGLLTRENSGAGRVLPIWHNIEKDEVSRASPILASKMARNTTERSIEELADELVSICDGDAALPRRPSPASKEQPPKPSAALEGQLKQWHEAGRQEFEREVSSSTAPTFIGYSNVQLSYAIERADDQVLDPALMREIALQLNREIRDRVNSGWSLFYPFDRAPVHPFFVTDSAAGKEELEILESSLLRDEGAIEEDSDLWRLSPDGAATQLRPIRYDFLKKLPQRFTPQRWFSPNITAREVGELVRHAQAFASRFGSPSRVAFRCEWRGLKGREFLDPNHDWHPGYFAQSESRIATGTWPIETLENEWPHVVAKIVGPVIRAFRTDLSLNGDWVLSEAKSWRPMGSHYP